MVGETPVWMLGFVEIGVPHLCRGLVKVQVQIFLGIHACGRDRWRSGWEFEVVEDFLQHLDVGDHRHDNHLCSAFASQGVYAEGPFQ